MSSIELAQAVQTPQAVLEAWPHIPTRGSSVFSLRMWRQHLRVTRMCNQADWIAIFRELSEMQGFRSIRTAAHSWSIDSTMDAFIPSKNGHY